MSGEHVRDLNHQPHVAYGPSEASRIETVGEDSVRVERTRSRIPKRAIEAKSKELNVINRKFFESLVARLTKEEK